MSQPYDEFDEPGPASGALVKPKDVVGHLLLVWAIDYIPYSQTKYTRPDKPSDVVVVDVVDLDQVDETTGAQGLLVRRTWWRNARLIQALRPRIDSGRPVLAHMGVGRATMGNPPFELVSATNDPQAVARARAWMQRNPGFQPSEKWTGTMEAPAPEPTSSGPSLEDMRKGTLERMARQAQQPLPPYPPQYGDIHPSLSNQEAPF
jgi:hypothetical protein